MSASYLEVQQGGLEALYAATGGEQWTSSTGWLDDGLGVCSWYGVTCDSSGQNMTALSLAGNGLMGDLADAPELFNILSLVRLDLSNNKLVGPVAPGFGLMPGLEVLDLSRNGLSSFPASWGAEASSLQHLSLQLNNISGYVVAKMYMYVRMLQCKPTTTVLFSFYCIPHRQRRKQHPPLRTFSFPEVCRGNHCCARERTIVGVLGPKPCGTWAVSTEQRPLLRDPAQDAAVGVARHRQQHCLSSRPLE